MILPFSQKFPDGSPTYFAEKIYRAMLWTQEEIEDFAKIMKVDITKNFYFDTELSFKSHPKIHTIRKDKMNQWKAGVKIHPVYNHFQNNQFQFAPTLACKSVQEISITKCWFKPVSTNNYFIKPLKSGAIECYIVIIDHNSILPKEEIIKLAINEGFDSVEDFFNRFDSDFEGKIIHFTDFRY